MRAVGRHVPGWAVAAALVGASLVGCADPGGQASTVTEMSWQLPASYAARSQSLPLAESVRQASGAVALAVNVADGGLRQEALLDRELSAREQQAVREALGELVPAGSASFSTTRRLVVSLRVRGGQDEFTDQQVQAAALDLARQSTSAATTGPRSIVVGLGESTDAERFAEQLERELQQQLGDSLRVSISRS